MNTLPSHCRVVYEASGPILVKTKSLSEFNGDKAKLEQEGNIMSGFRHRNIVHYISHIVDGDVVKISMEYCPGGTLKAFIDRQRDKFQYLQMAAILKLSLEELSGLAFLHSKDYIHRNICPDNIYLSRDFVAVIANFANTRKPSDHMTIVETLTSYTPRDQKRDQYTKSIDIFALGCVWYEMVALQPLFTVRDIIREAPPDIQFPPCYVGTIVEQFKELISKMVSHNPDDRPTANQLLNDQLFQKFKSSQKQLVMLPVMCQNKINSLQDVAPEYQIEKY